MPALLSVGSAGVAIENANRWGSSASDVQHIKLYRDNYMRWNRLLNKAANQQGGGVSLQGRVEDILGVPVVN